MQAAHERSPKYDFREESADAVVKKYNMEILALSGKHLTFDDGKLAILDGNERCVPEEFVARYFRRAGYEVQFVESRPFHVLFGVFMWMLIQDPGDPLARHAGFGDRHAFERGEKAEMIWTLLPEDFGSPTYATRRATAIDEHFRLLGSEREHLEGTFDYWIGASEPLRQYLWAHQDTDVSRARQLLKALPTNVTLGILRFLLGSYWERYLGWPDLLCHRRDTFFFVEVKSSRDKLSQQQKQWISSNATELRLPFKIVKIHRDRTTN
jgi:hypothetical protein